MGFTKAATGGATSPGPDEGAEVAPDGKLLYEANFVLADFVRTIGARKHATPLGLHLLDFWRKSLGSFRFLERLNSLGWRRIWDRLTLI